MPWYAGCPSVGRLERLFGRQVHRILTGGSVQFIILNLVPVDRGSQRTTHRKSGGESSQTIGRTASLDDRILKGPWGFTREPTVQPYRLPLGQRRNDISGDPCPIHLL